MENIVRNNHFGSEYTVYANKMTDKVPEVLRKDSENSSLKTVLGRKLLAKHLLWSQTSHSYHPNCPPSTF